MTEPLPELNVPTGASKFNTPAGNGFAKWFADIKQGIDVLGVEVLNRAHRKTLETIVVMDVVQGGDARILEVNDESDLSFGITDEDGRRLWLEAGLDGGPTKHSADFLGGSKVVITALGEGIGLGSIDPSASDLSFALVDEDGRRLELEMGPDGKVTARVLAAWASRMGTVVGASIPDFPTDDWAHWGDSMTAAGWSATMAGYTGKQHYNGGVGGQTTEAIAARQGGVPALLILAGNTIPASGAVAVTSVINNPLSNSSARNGTLAGVGGILTRDASGAYTFTRAAPGTATAVPAGSAFTPKDGVENRGRHVTIWTGRNGIHYGHTPSYIVSCIQAMIDYLTPRVKRVIVMEIAPSDDETSGTPKRAVVDAANAAIAAAFPAEWLASAAWLRTPAAAAAAGITFTAEDNADIAAGITPRNLRSDNLHLNAAGNQAVAKRVYAEAQTKGWL